MTFQSSICSQTTTIRSAVDPRRKENPSTVEAYLSLSDDEGRPLRVPEVVACIGPTTAEAARRSGLAVAVEARDASAEALAVAVAAHLGAAGRLSS